MHELEVQIGPLQGEESNVRHESVIEWLELQHLTNFAESQWNQGGTLCSSILIYADHQAAAEEIGRSLYDAFGPAINLIIRELPEDTWRNSWREDYSSLTTDKFVVQLDTDNAPQAPSPGKRTIHLNPGSAFGRGDHATTEAVLRLMEKHLPGALKNYELIDVGTGNGVLCIAAHFLGCKRAVGTEIEETILDEARKNLKKNNVAAELQLQANPSELGMFDVVCCNVLSGALYDLLPQLRQNLKSDGMMFLSGFIEKELDVFSKRLNDLDLKEVDRCVIRGWVALLVAAA